MRSLAPRRATLYRVLTSAHTNLCLPGFLYLQFPSFLFYPFIIASLFLLSASLLAYHSSPCAYYRSSPESICIYLTLSSARAFVGVFRTVPGHLLRLYLGRFPAILPTSDRVQILSRIQSLLLAKHLHLLLRSIVKSALFCAHRTEPSISQFQSWKFSVCVG